LAEFTIDKYFFLSYNKGEINDSGGIFMKKLTALLLFCMMLCGCGSVSQESTSEADAVSEETTTGENPDECFYYDGSVSFDTIDEFFSSDYAEEQRENCPSLAIPVYDTERFEVRGVGADRGFYEIYYKDLTNGNMICCSIESVNYNTEDGIATYFTGDDEMMDQELTTAEKDGVEYTVLYASTNWEETMDYSLSYFPFDNCMVTFLITNDEEVSKEEILDVFNQFEIQPYYTE
jgi:hypothetical protein